MNNVVIPSTNMRKCLAWLIVVDYLLIAFYVYLATSLLYFDVFLIGVLIAVYNLLMVTFVVKQPAGFITLSRDKHLVLPICFAAFLGSVIVVLTVFW